MALDETLPLVCRTADVRRLQTMPAPQLTSQKIAREDLGSFMRLHAVYNIQMICRGITIHMAELHDSPYN